MKQTDKVRAWLEGGHTLTSLEAVDFLGITRLAARISDLKQEGVAVQSETVTVKNRFGDDCHVSSYSIITNIEQEEMAL